MRDTIAARGVVFVEITNACNYSCSHCYLGALPSFRYDEASLTDIHRAFDALGAHAIDEVRFTGGEPMLAASLAPMIDMCKSRGLPYTLVSNGSGITAANWAAIRAYPPRLVWISLYSSDKRLHERITRKVGSFVHLAKTIRRLDHIQVKCGVHIVVWPPLVGHMSKQLDFAFDELGATELKCIPVQFAGAAAQSTDRLVMNIEELRQVREEVYAWCLSNPGKRVRVAGRLAQPEGKPGGCMFRDRVFLTINYMGMISPCCLLMHDEPWLFTRPDAALTAAANVNGKGLPCAGGKTGVCPLSLADGSAM